MAQLLSAAGATIVEVTDLKWFQTLEMVSKFK